MDHNPPQVVVGTDWLFWPVSRDLLLRVLWYWDLLAYQIRELVNSLCRDGTHQHTSSLNIQTLYIHAYTFYLGQSGSSVVGHIQFSRELKIVIKLHSCFSAITIHTYIHTYIHIHVCVYVRTCSLSASSLLIHGQCTMFIPSPLPVIVKSLELNDQHFRQSTNAQSLHCIHLIYTYNSTHVVQVATMKLAGTTGTSNRFACIHYTTRNLDT